MFRNKTKTKKETCTLSNTVHSLQPSGIRKFFDILSSMDGVISLGVGEPDYTTPWHIREAAIYSLEQGQTMYTSNQGLPELRTELSGYINREYGVQYDPDKELLITVGVSEALDLAMRAILNRGDEVIMTDPSYVAYPACVVLAGGVPIFVPVLEENEFQIKANDIEKRISKKTKAILLGYPSNPTGAVLSKEEMIRIAEVAEKHNIFIISDEVYSHLVYGVEHTCMSSLQGIRNRVILLNGFSKAFAMTGWRLGYAAAHPKVISAMTKIHQYTMLCAPIMAQMAAIEALKAGARDVEEMVSEYDRRRHVMLNGLRKIGLTCVEPKGAFYCFPSIRITGMKSEEFAEKLLYEEKVAAVHGTAFGSHGEGYIRCCYATALSDIEEAIYRMGKFIQRHRIS
jgi:aminotransferase